MKQDPIRDSRSGQIEIILAVLIALGILVLAGTGNITPKKPFTGIDSRATSTQKDDTPPLPEDSDTYFIQSGDAGPKIHEATINPLGGAKLGVRQNWSVKARHDKAIISVSVTMIMDNDSYVVPLSLIQGSALDGIWSGSWEVKDTHENKYQAVIEAVGRDGKKSRIVLTFQPTKE